MKLVRDKKYPELYKLQWPNGDISISTPHPDRKGGHYGFYNKTRAKEHMLREDILDLPQNVSVAHPRARGCV
jgi:hypothetical protein